MGALGFADTAADTFERGGPYLVRGAADLVPTAKLFDYYSPQLFCTLRNYAEIAGERRQDARRKRLLARDVVGHVRGRGQPLHLPRQPAAGERQGGPEGRPGCWQQPTKDLWPMPYLVMDTGYSIAPYNHIEIGQPIAIDYVWGRQIGELTINP